MVRLEVSAPSALRAASFCFNSKMVRLEVLHAKQSRCALGKFQFQDGAIRGMSSLLGITFARSFQFQDGAIRGDNRTEDQARRDYRFNSKMVRLEVRCSLSLHHLDVGFNSKMVRLEVSLWLGNHPYCGMFQFQDGAIRGPGNGDMTAEEKRFNSKMVRLEVLSCFQLVHLPCLFQFQDGAIRGPVPARAAFSSAVFQFQDGAIRGFLHQR